MDLDIDLTSLSPAAARLREEVRAFVAELPAELTRRWRRHGVLAKADYVAWMRRLQTRGWAAGHWPRDHGGLGWSLLERFAFEDELARQGCPWLIPFGVKYVGPVLYTHGSAEQRARFLPRILSSDDWWAQGFSESEAGSDLAALRTRAVRDGEDYVVHGRKLWTTYAQWADWMFCLVRTARDTPRPHDGLSFVLVDLRGAGVTVRPVRTMDGYHHVNEVWLEGVRVPVANRVGAEGAGWSFARFLLRNERTAGAIVGQGAHALERLRRLAREQGAGPRWCERVGTLALRLLALETMAYEAVAAMEAGSDRGEASMIKIRGAELHQDVNEALVELLGPAGIVLEPAALLDGTPAPLGPDDASGLVKEHLYNRSATIFGGSSEIQRNILARRALGL